MLIDDISEDLNEEEYMSKNRISSDVHILLDIIFPMVSDYGILL